MKLNQFVLVIIGASLLAQLPAVAKTWTVDQRQTQQMKDINNAQKSGQLTAKEAEKLRKGLAKVARIESKLKAKQNNKLSAEDVARIQTCLNKVSTDIAATKHAKSEPPAKPAKK